MSDLRENCLISIIIPVYNVEKYLKRCIESVLQQSFQSIEIILVDDGSNDNSGRICDEYEKIDNRIQVIHKKNAGLSSARNAGIEQSSGEFITFIDSDDWVSPMYCEYLYYLMETYKVDMSMCAHIKTANYDSEAFEFGEDTVTILSSRDFLLKLLKVGTQENVQYTWGKLYKNFKNTAIRFPEGLIDEDVPTTFKYVCNTKTIALSKRPLYAYFENRNSILRQRFSRKRFDLISVWKIVYDYAIQNCDKELIYYCRMNLYRANFGVLCNICTKEIDEEDYAYIHEQELKALNVVKKHSRELLRFQMPLSRKVVMLFMCMNYRAVKSISKKLGIRINI